MPMKNLNCCLGLTVAALCAQSALGAISNLNAGESADLFGITWIEDNSLAGLIVPEGDIIEQFTIGEPAGSYFEATLQSRAIIRSDNGMMDFSWHIRDIENFSSQIASVVVNGYEAWSVGVEYRVDGSGDLGPDSAFRSADGDSVEYNFENGGLGYPDESKFFFSRTDAMGYDTSGTIRITLVTGEFVELDTWAPAVPAPGAISLLGLGGIVAGRRR
tara:strand:+ start:37 stop:687 length:651 start_codon:yes stop_codon:yes gene_type:complete